LKGSEPLIRVETGGGKRKQDEPEYFACDSAATPFHASARRLQRLAFSVRHGSAARLVRNMTHN
jgi:hypothetical protein